jgi:glycosyltransferase involved in cell wall biosynthesis
MTPEVSVIMSVYNSETTLEAAVDSILGQSFENFEFIIVNDGSSDKTADILKRCEGKDKRVRVLTNETNIGLTRSLNKAISASSGRYIARQDADDLSLPDRMGKQIVFLRDHPEIALLGTSKAVLDGSGKVIGTNPLPELPDYNRLLKSNCFAHGSVMIRREVLEETGGYNEDFRMSQDYELWLRIAKTRRIANLPEPLYGVRRHGTRLTLTRMFQAGLYRILAVNLSRGEVPQAVMEQIRRDGIETYYEHLNRRDRLKYNTAATAKCIKNRRYDDAEKYLCKLIEIAPLRLKARLQLIYVRIKKKQAVSSPR